MKNIIFTLMFISSVFSSFAQESEKNEQNSYLYLFRKGEFNGALQNFSIYIDDKKVCEISNNRYLKIKLKPGKHIITGHIGSIQLLQKITELEIESVAGQDNFVSCDIKQSFTRVRLDMTEVVKSSYIKASEKLELDRCQLKIEGKDTVPMNE